MGGVDRHEEGRDDSAPRPVKVVTAALAVRTPDRELGFMETATGPT